MILYQCDICGGKDLAENADFVHIGDLILCKKCYKKVVTDDVIDEVLGVVENLEQSNYTTPLFGNDGKCAGFLINTWVLRDEIMALKADTINDLEGKE